MESNKVTIVTGAASGIGRATSIFLAQRGHQVVCTDLPATKLGELQELTGGICIEADVRIESEVDALIKGAVDKYGRIDGVAEQWFDNDEALNLAYSRQVSTEIRADTMAHVARLIVEELEIPIN